MKQSIIGFVVIILGSFYVVPARADVLNVKLPYLKGQSFVVVQGYGSLPTHIKKDSYALDLSQNGCQAYGKPVAASAAGTAMIVIEEGYNGGYGAEVLINHGNDIVSRYAHMIPGSIKVGVGTPIEQGQVIGAIGDSGLVAGFACPEHPGTHLHFAMDIRHNDGTLDAHDPEPISGYRNITEGKWYLSDNLELASAASVPPVATTQTTTVAFAQSSTVGEVLGAATSTILSPQTASATPVIPIVPIGGVSIISPPPQTSPTPITISTASTTVTVTTSSTTTIVATSSSPPLVASSSSIIFQQLDDSASSPFSWYEDNWFDLGSGLSGTLNTLTLEAKVSDQAFFASHVELQEFKDPNYTTMVKQFTISDDAPFTGNMASATFTGLSILLKPYFYYRLATVQDRQNRSIILAGTSATGTEMWDNFVYGVGRVESTGTFMPFMEMNGVIATSTLLPPSLTAPKNIIPKFDQLGMKLNVSFSTSTDPDWSENPLHYEINFSTSTTLDDAQWGSSLQAPVAVGNSYLIGVRALDDFGDVSAVATTTWDFPPGFIPYKLSAWINYATQDFTVPVGGTLGSIEVFTSNFATASRNPDTNSCDLSLWDYNTLLPLWIASSDSEYSGYRCGGDLTFSFASSSLPILPDHRYQWLFQLHDGGPSARGGIQFFGTASDTAGGPFSDPTIANAKFTIESTSGILFAN